MCIRDRPSTSQICGKISMAKYEVPGSKLLGQYISSEFAKGYNTVMLELSLIHI